MRKYLLMSFIVVLFLLVPVKANASTLDSDLLKIGVEEYVIQNLNSTQKEDLLTNAKDREYGGSKIVKYNSTTNSYSELNLNEVSTMGAISPEELVLTLTYLTKKNSSNQLESVRLQAYYHWTDNPVNRFKDPISLSWDSDHFRSINNSFYYINGYLNYNIYTFTYDEVIRDEGYMASRTEPAGVLWYADLPGFGGTKDMWGIGRIDIEPQPDSTLNKITDSAQFYLNYAHSKFPIGITVNIGSSGSVSFSGGVTDTLGNSLTGYWDYTKYVSSPYISMASNSTSSIKVAIKNTYNINAEIFVKISGRISTYESIGYVNAGETTYKTFYGLSSGTNYTVYAYADRQNKHASTISTKAVYTKSSGGVTPTPYVIKPEIY